MGNRSLDSAREPKNQSFDTLLSLSENNQLKVVIGFFGLLMKLSLKRTENANAATIIAEPMRLRISFLLRALRIRLPEKMPDSRRRVVGLPIFDRPRRPSSPPSLSLPIVLYAFQKSQSAVRSKEKTSPETTGPERIQRRAETQQPKQKRTFRNRSRRSRWGSRT